MKDIYLEMKEVKTKALEIAEAEQSLRRTLLDEIQKDLLEAIRLIEYNHTGGAENYIELDFGEGTDNNRVYQKLCIRLANNILDDRSRHSEENKEGENNE